MTINYIELMVSNLSSVVSLNVYDSLVPGIAPWAVYNAADWIIEIPDFLPEARGMVDRSAT